MKTKFFLCMRPPVIETEDSGKTSGRRNRDLRRKKSVAPNKCIGQLSIKSNDNSVHKDSQNPEAHVLESVSLNNISVISNNKVNVGGKSNSGACIMVSSLFFTMFFGKLFGIVCTLLILVWFLYPHDRKSDVKENMVVVKGSPEEYKKRVIMAGLLERKSHYNYR